MNKFKVGDKVKLLRNIGGNSKNDICEIIALDNHDENWCYIRTKNNTSAGLCCDRAVKPPCSYLKNDFFELATDRYELHITCNDGKTTNAIYKVNGEIKERKQAICAPSDTFDFAKGVQTALDRVFPQPAQEEPAKPKELIKLYCVKNKTDVGVKDYSEYLTVGKIYEFDGHYIEYDKLTSVKFEDFDHWKKGDNGFASCLVPLVSRPAKVGEWIYISIAVPILDQTYKIGDVFKVTETGDVCAGDVRVDGVSKSFIDRVEYLVLDGYKPEPEYYNGKVVCVDNGFIATLTVGKVYEVKDGFFYNDAGHKNPLATGAIKTLDDMNARHSAKFIEFKGE